jgi:hypothetical protein
MSPYAEPDLLLYELVELLTGYLGGKVRPPRGPVAPVAAAAEEPDLEVTPPKPAGPEPVKAETGELEAAEPGTVAPEPVEPEPAPDPFEVWG